MDGDDTWTYSFVTRFAEPLDHEITQAQQLPKVMLPDCLPTMTRQDDWGFDPGEQCTRASLSIGEEDINRNDLGGVASTAAIKNHMREFGRD